MTGASRRGSRLLHDHDAGTGDAPSRSLLSLLTDSVSLGVILGKNVNIQPQHKYARIERERQFLLDRFPRKLGRDWEMKLFS
jgi:hypothetical protein